MRNILFSWGLTLLWSAVGRLGRDLGAWIEQAEASQLAGKDAFRYVWVNAKSKYQDIGDWLLNLLIEVLVGKRELETKGSLARKLKWPANIKISL